MRGKLVSITARLVLILVAFLFIQLLEKFAEENYAGPVITVILAVVTLLGMIGAWFSIKTYRAVPHNVDLDVSDQNRLLPASLQPSVAPLLEQDFTRLGEYATMIKGNKELGTCWCYVNTSRTTLLEVVTVRGFPMFQFSSIYPDNAFLETMYPHGEIITTPDYRVRTVSNGSLTTAYEQHLADLPLFAAHGSPIPIRDMAHNLQIGREFRQRYGQRKLQQPVWISLAFPIFFGIFTLLMGFISFSGHALSRRAELVVILGLLNLAFMLTPVLFPGPRRAAAIFWAGIAALFIVLLFAPDTPELIAFLMLGQCLLVIFYLFSARGRLKSLFGMARLRGQHS